MNFDLMFMKYLAILDRYKQKMNLTTFGIYPNFIQMQSCTQKIYTEEV